MPSMNIPPKSPLPATDWARARALYELAIDLPADQREAFVRAAGDTDAVCAEVLALLLHSTDAGARPDGFLDTPVGAPLRPPARDGQRLGPWQLDSPLGSGGMGEVYRAHRADGAYVGGAAVKILKRGMDSVGVLQRFAQEQQALATLNHPHIARLFDAGLTPDGLPYFVMELVEGRAIDEACAGLPLPQQLQVFLQLADAVAYAHRMLLVHRDLKPGNVLVTADGQVKLLDFGIAKALDANDGASVDITAGTQRPFTPSHASPEQVRGERVGTATDIYSLGVLLYQLLTGQRPYGRSATNAAEAARAVLEEAPTRPSSLSPPDEADSTWIAHRDTLKGDLDNILLKALEKPLDRRYISVDALAADVRAYLTGYPVSAREPMRRYLMAKFVARNRVAVGSAAAAVVALAVGLGATLWQAHEAGIARDEAQRRLADIRTITRDLVFRFGDAVTYLPGGMKVKEDMLQNVLLSLDRLATSADRDPALLADVATTYARLAELQGNDQSMSLGKPEAARINADKAIALATELLPQRRDDWKLAHWAARAYDIRAKVFRGQDKPREGIAELDQAVAVLGQVDLSHADDLGRVSIPGERASLMVTQGQLLEQLAQRNLATADEVLRKMGEAEAATRGLLAQRELLERLDRAGPPEEAKGYAQVQSNLGVILDERSGIHLRLEQLDAALEEARAGVEVHRGAVASDPATTLWKDGLATAANQLAVVHLRRGEFAAALDAIEVSEGLGAQLARGEGPQSKWALHLPQLGQQRSRALAGLGRHAEALPVFDTAIAYWEATARSPPNERAGDNARRVAALLLAGRSASLAALGQRAAAEVQAASAVGTLRAMARAPGHAREVELNAAEAIMLLGDLRPAERPTLRAEALQLLTTANAALPLAGLNAGRLAALRADASKL
jgi:tetratricopeptide (TPR) repeat protein